MFTTGRVTFAIIALIIFVVLLIFSYKGDKKSNRTYFKGSYVVLIAFLVFMAFLVVLKFFMESR